LNSKKKIRAENRNSGQDDETHNEPQAGGYERVLFKKETTNLKLFMSGYTSSAQHRFGIPLKDR